MGTWSFTTFSLFFYVREISVMKSFVTLVILVNNVSKLLYLDVHFFEYLSIDCLFLDLLLKCLFPLFPLYTYLPVF